MTLSDQLIRDEGVRLFAYLDSRGYVTIGVGRCLDKNKGRGITRNEAMVLLQNDIVWVKSEIASHLPWAAHLDDARMGVLCNMVFNLGMDGLLEFHDFLGHVQRGEYGDAADAMLHSTWAGQVGDRATRLSRQMTDGVMY